MTAKITADATGTKVTIGTAAEDALQIDATAKTIKALAPYLLIGGPEIITGPTGISLKFPDGTLIFFGRTSFTPGPFTRDGTSQLWYSEVANAFGFPVAFIATPSVLMTASDQNISLRSAYCAFVNPSATGVPSCWLTSPTNSATAPGVAPMVLTCIAWGRWKA
jgi:hypothetical protein